MFIRFLKDCIIVYFCLLVALSGLTLYVGFGPTATRGRFGKWPFCYKGVTSDMVGMSARFWCGIFVVMAVVLGIILRANHIL